MTSQKIIPSIWFNRTADEAAAFYTSVFPDTTIVQTVRYPETGLLPFQEEFAGQTLTIDIDIAGTRLSLINADEHFAPNPSISFVLNFDPSVLPDAKAQLERAWEQLVDGGHVLMPLGEYPFMARYGWLADRFGVNWQLCLTDPAGDPRPFVTPQLLFVGEAPQAEAASAKYIKLFDGSRGATLPNPDVPGAVMYSDFQLAGQWFSAIDGGRDHEFSFSEGVSLLVEADGQEELDRLWAALSAVPEAEACGWCKDEFGVSWQIVPANLGELMQKPGAYSRLMGMKKIVIDDF
ncbi:VOC family protein [Corynebacterium sp. H78]|uniref:VOC family protein n=1 Tax=Corynebacterium sp. H78 TaxID=3133417 RepID=UPI0030A8B3C0